MSSGVVAELAWSDLTIHDCESWQDPAVPVRGSFPFSWANVTHEAVHYTAALNLPDGDPGEHANDLPGYIRRIQADYALRRGYSIGYNWIVDWLGGVWEGRGWRYSCAANLGSNAIAFAVLMLVDGQDEATPEALASARAIAREFERRKGRELEAIQGHGWLDKSETPTQCPGLGIGRQLRAELRPGITPRTGGMFHPRYVIPPAPPITQPTPTPPTEEDDMLGKMFQVNDGDPLVMVRFGSRVTSGLSKPVLDDAIASGLIEAPKDWAKLPKVTRASLALLEWYGPDPDYTGAAPGGGRTKLSDFA